MGKDQLFDFLTELQLAVFVTDAKGRVVLWNDRAGALLGMPAADVLGCLCSEVLPHCPCTLQPNRVDEEKGVQISNQISVFPYQSRALEMATVWVPSPRSSLSTCVHLLIDPAGPVATKDVVERLLAHLDTAASERPRKPQSAFET